jgi:hypothetical protein
MPKADVTYNTIGFVGTVGTGATFTLYLDDEKTGAKTYHVYFKQLGGTGKLTLTTGKAGATNLTLNAGTYVAIIYVDENGNITNTASTPTATIEAGSTQPATSGGVSTQITNTISGLSVSSVGGSGKYIEAISETNGKISATVQNIANEVTANNMQSVTSNAVYNALLSHPIRVWATVQTVYYNLPVNIPKSFFTLGRTYIISLTGSYANAYSGMYLLFYGNAHVSSYTICKTISMNDLTVGTDNVTISFVQQVGIGADSARVDVIML